VETKEELKKRGHAEKFDAKQPAEEGNMAQMNASARPWRDGLQRENITGMTERN